MLESRIRQIYETRGADAARQVAVATRERRFITLINTLAAFDQRPVENSKIRNFRPKGEGRNGQRME